MKDQNLTPKTTAKKVWTTPKLRRLGSLQELTRTQDAGEQRMDHLVSPYYYVS